MQTGWWIHDLYERSPVLLASWVFWVLLSIMLHELAHGWAAIWQGDDTPRHMNRMNLNPLTHMGPTSLIFFALTGFAWGMMPIDPSRFRWGRRGEALVALAGPLMNVAIAAVALTALGIWLARGPSQKPIYDNLQIFLYAGGWLNLFLAAFNLLPIPPLDGARILAGISRPARDLIESPQVMQYGWLGIFALSMLGFFNPVQKFVQTIAINYSERIALFFNP
ncbi:MAG: site-2 protease family protein [Planctomycetes bacterium]|nr:site-2 protease family protein [Planctomycetota bacterium]